MSAAESLGLRIGRFGISDLGGLADLHQGEGWHLPPMPRESGFQSFVGFQTGRRERHQVNDVVNDAIDRKRESADQPVALYRMASNTGGTLSGALAMTFRISAVAACCSRASFKSVPNRRPNDA